jgi:predicted nucleotidyltransferase component of viral defense system
MKDTIFFKQAELLLRILPLIEKEDVFALKGGTAINFFYQNMPCISVDIDLAYVPVNDRDTALKDIHSRLILISEEIKRKIPGTDIIFKRIHNSEQLNGLIVDQGGVTVKIEPNLVLKGTVYPPEKKYLCKKAQDIFEMSLKSRVLSTPDLYAGKICAALDRQHPRDLFDIYLLLKSDGLNSETRKAFIVYLISHPRPMFEILNPKAKDITGIYEKEFKGMIAEDIPIAVLEKSLNDLVKKLKEEFTENERRFILSVKKSHPEWDLLELNGVQNLPAIKWKLMNISKMDPLKHREAVEKLKDYLNI